MEELIAMVIDLQIKNQKIEFLVKSNAYEDDDIATAKRGSGSRKPHLKGRAAKNKEWRKPSNRGANHDRVYFHGRRDELRNLVVYEDDVTMMEISAIIDAEYDEEKKLAEEAKKMAEAKVELCKARVMWALQELQQAEEELAEIK